MKPVAGSGAGNSFADAATGGCAHGSDLFQMPVAQLALLVLLVADRLSFDETSGDARLRALLLGRRLFGDGLRAGLIGGHKLRCLIRRGSGRYSDEPNDT